MQTRAVQSVPKSVQKDSSGDLKLWDRPLHQQVAIVLFALFFWPLILLYLSPKICGAVWQQLLLPTLEVWAVLSSSIVPESFEFYWRTAEKKALPSSTSTKSTQNVQPSAKKSAPKTQWSDLSKMQQVITVIVSIPVWPLLLAYLSPQIAKAFAAHVALPVMMWVKFRILVPAEKAAIDSAIKAFKFFINVALPKIQDMWIFIVELYEHSIGDRIAHLRNYMLVVYEKHIRSALSRAFTAFCNILEEFYNFVQKVCKPVIFKLHQHTLQPLITLTLKISEALWKRVPSLETLVDFAMSTKQELIRVTIPLWQALNVTSNYVFEHFVDPMLKRAGMLFIMAAKAASLVWQRVLEFLAPAFRMASHLYRGVLQLLVQIAQLLVQLKEAVLQLWAQVAQLLALAVAAVRDLLPFA